MSPFPPREVNAGATNPPNPNPSATGTVQAATDDLRAELAALVRQPDDGLACGPTEAYALRVADAVLAAGYRRVVVDAEDRVADVLADWVDGNGPQAFWTTEDAARAAVRAVLEGPDADDRSDLCQGCGGPLSEGGHGMSEYGGCV